jgi:hypothetical protein
MRSTWKIIFLYWSEFQCFGSGQIFVRFVIHIWILLCTGIIYVPVPVCAVPVTALPVSFTTGMFFIMKPWTAFACIRKCLELSASIYPQNLQFSSPKKSAFTWKFCRPSSEIRYDFQTLWIGIKQHIAVIHVTRIGAINLMYFHIVLIWLDFTYFRTPCRLIWRSSGWTTTRSKSSSRRTSTSSTGWSTGPVSGSS